MVVAKKNGYTALGISDDNMFGVMEFYTLALKNDIKPIVGLSIIINDLEILLYAKNYNGYQNLCYICSNDKTLNLLKENNNNLICVVPFSSLQIYDELSNIFTDIYVSYSTNEEREKLTNQKCIYLNEIRCLNKEDKEYLKYLYMIKDGVKLTDKKEYIFNYDNYLMNIDEAVMRSLCLKKEA